VRPAQLVDDEDEGDGGRKQRKVKIDRVVRCHGEDEGRVAGKDRHGQERDHAILRELERDDTR
jgi:hypothetical protein